jgi:diguanylate cyclase (GGDEF)-like protein
LPSPGAPIEFRSSAAGSFLEIIVETLQRLDHSARAQFLRAFLRTLTHLDLSEEKSLEIWDEILLRQQTLSGSSGQAVPLQTALVDVFTTSGLFRFPLLVERDNLKKLELSAVTDALTGLHNRRLFQETFEKELNRARRYALPLSLVTLDLHRFKEVNDQLGHPRGDDVLRAVASTLTRSLRTSDSAFRVGGDEFSLLLPQTDTAQAFALAKRISATFSEVLETLQISIAVSMDHGIATYSSDGETAEQLIQVADERLYRLKHANRGKIAAEADSGEKTAASEEPASTPVSPPAEAFSIRPPAEGSARAAEPPEPEKSVPVEMPRPVESSESSLAAAVSASAASRPSDGSSPVPGIESRPIFAVQRKAERVSMTGTNAYAVLGDVTSRRAKVVDLGFGGVALELESKQDLPDNFLAVLHVPILPPVRVNLKPVWSRPTSGGSVRVGCCFIS